MDFQKEIAEYKTSLQVFFLGQTSTYQRLIDQHLTSEEALRDIGLVQSYIQSIFQVLDEIKEDISKYHMDYLTINDTRSILSVERERAQRELDKKLLFLDDQKISKTFNSEVKKDKIELLNKLRACIEMTKQALINNGYLDTHVVTGNGSISIVEIIDRLEFIGENMTPRIDNIPSLEYLTDSEIIRKLQVIGEFEKSGIELDPNNQINFLTKVIGDPKRQISTGKNELLRMSSSIRKTKACRDSIDRLDPVKYQKTREVLMNLITRYKNEYKLNELLFKASDYELIESTVKRFTEDKRREERINKYAGIFALFLEKLDSGSDDIEEFEEFLTSYELSDDEMIIGRINGTQMYEENKLRKALEQGEESEEDVRRKA